MEAAAPSAKKRRAEALETGKTSTLATAATGTPSPEATPTKKTGAHNSQRPPPPPGTGGDGNGGGVDRISGLPDAILSDIISLLPSKDAARTQILAYRWHHIWRAAPLNLDCRGLPDEDEVLAGVVSRIISAHHGPGRLFCVPAHHLHDRAATVDAWLRSPALDNLQEIDFCYRRRPPLDQPQPTPPAFLFRFSSTLRAATIGQCHIPDGGPGQAIHFPQLQQLALPRVRISQASLHSMISRCPALEYLFLDGSYGFCRVRINSTSLRSIGVRAEYLGPTHLVIEDAPCLEKLLCADDEDTGLNVSVKVEAAPKLETVGCVCDSTDRFGSSRHVFGSTAFQGLRLVSLTTMVHNVKILAVHSWSPNLEMVIDLMKCFPCLEKLYIKDSVSRAKNRCRRKHKHFIECFGIRLKTIDLEDYRGTRSQVNFASFFLLNARELELIGLEVTDGKRCNEEFLAEQSMVLQMQKWASEGARLEFATNRCCCHVLNIGHVRDLSIIDPFECRCCSSVDS